MALVAYMNTTHTLGKTSSSLVYMVRKLKHLYLYLVAMTISMELLLMYTSERLWRRNTWSCSVMIKGDYETIICYPFWYIPNCDLLCHIELLAWDIVISDNWWGDSETVRLEHIMIHQKQSVILIWHIPLCDKSTLKLYLTCFNTQLSPFLCCHVNAICSLH